jgi:hypothetical protein
MLSPGFWGVNERVSGGAPFAVSVVDRSSYKRSGEGNGNGSGNGNGNGNGDANATASASASATATADSLRE